MNAASRKRIAKLTSNYEEVSTGLIANGYVDLASDAKLP